MGRQRQKLDLGLDLGMLTVEMRPTNVKLSRGCFEVSMEMRSVGVWFFVEGYRRDIVSDEER